MLAEEIRNNWTGAPVGFAVPISSVTKQGYEAWTLKIGAEYGVAIPIDDQTIKVSEKFAGARLYTHELIMKESDNRHVLVLAANTDNISIPFSALCAELVHPGKDGIFRKKILESPTSWWIEWKELLGNKNVDERVYDTLGELYALRTLAHRHINAIWNGPNGATYDIDCDGVYYEVKSTTARNKREIKISNPYQLAVPDGSELFLVLCQFERSEQGMCINDIINDLVCLGYSRSDLETKLELLGLEEGKSSRNREYILHAATRYKIDESFPKITDQSFFNGVRPNGIKTYSYVVDLDAVEGEDFERLGN